MDNNNTINIKGKVSLHNEFDIEVKDIRTGEIRQRGKAYNILLDGIYTRLCNRQLYFEAISFGSGTGITNPTRTTLFNQIASLIATNVEEIRDVANNIYYRKRKIVLLPANYVGETITEVGMYGYGLNSHALIQDSEGNTISIPKTEFDEITIYATVYFQLYDNGNIKWSNLPNGNALLNYLFGGSIAPPAIQVGQSIMESTEQSILAQIASKNTSYLADVANKKIKTNVVRFETVEGNGDIFEIGLDKIFRAQIPVAGIWDGYNVVNEAVGTGDGITNIFSLKKNFIKKNTDVIKIDNIVQTRNIDYLINPIKNETNITSQITEVKSSHQGIILNTIDNNVNTGFRLDSIPSWIQFKILDDYYQDIFIGKIRWQYATGHIKTFKFQGSNDEIDWTDIHSETISTVYAGWNEISITPSDINYKYYRIYATEFGGGTGYGEVRELQFIHTQPQIQFTNPPSAGAVITVDYSIDHIPKDANHVIDVGFEIQWGEGSAS